MGGRGGPLLPGGPRINHRALGRRALRPIEESSVARGGRPAPLRGGAHRVHRAGDAPAHRHAPRRRPAVPWGIVFGAGLAPGGEPSPILAERLDTALALWRTGRVERLLLTGNADPYHDEIRSMRRYLTKGGVPERAISGDLEGMSTFDSCWRARGVFGVQRAILVTQALPSAAGGLPRAGRGHRRGGRPRRRWPLAGALRLARAAGPAARGGGRLGASQAAAPGRQPTGRLSPWAEGRDLVEPRAAAHLPRHHAQLPGRGSRQHTLRRATAPALTRWTFSVSSPSTATRRARPSSCRTPDLDPREVQGDRFDVDDDDLGMQPDLEPDPDAPDLQPDRVERFADARRATEAEDSRHQRRRTTF